MGAGGPQSRAVYGSIEQSVPVVGPHSLPILGISTPFWSLHLSCLPMAQNLEWPLWLNELQRGAGGAVAVCFVCS